MTASRPADEHTQTAAEVLAEPLLVHGMRHYPTGDVRHTPGGGIGACGCSAVGFLRELDEWADAIRAAAEQRGRDETARALSRAAVEAIREVHQRDNTEPHACDWCGEAWPCTPIRGLADHNDGSDR